MQRGGLLELRLGTRKATEDAPDGGEYDDEEEEHEPRVFPARLVNLPCVVEMHKTVDYVTLFKSGDVGQMVVVYANETELLEDLRREEEERDKIRQKGGRDGQADAELRVRQQLNYYHSGLTPPTTNIVRRRFAETRLHGPYPPAVVAKVQRELAAHVAALEEKREVAEVVEDVVEFEDYMADMHGQPVTIAEDSAQWLEHPELLIHRPVVLAPDDPAFFSVAAAVSAAATGAAAPATGNDGAHLVEAAALQQATSVMAGKGGRRGGGGGGRGQGGGGSSSGRVGRGRGAGRGGGRRNRGQQQGVGPASPGAAAAAVAVAGPVGGNEDIGGPLIMVEPPGGPPTYGEMQPPPPPPSHRRQKDPREREKDSRNLGGQRVGGRVITGNVPAPDLPPDPDFDNAFLGEDGEDDFLDFLEGGVGEEGGLMDEGLLD